MANKISSEHKLGLDESFISKVSSICCIRTHLKLLLLGKGPKRETAVSGEKNLSEQGREATANLTHLWRRPYDMILGGEYHYPPPPLPHYYSSK